MRVGADGELLFRGPQVFDGYFPDVDTRAIVEWFDLGGTLDLGDMEPAADVVRKAGDVQGLLDLSRRAGLPAASAPHTAAAVDFVLEGLHARKQISRSDGRGFHGSEPVRRPGERPTPVLTPDDDDEPGRGRKKKRYYN